MNSTQDSLYSQKYSLVHFINPVTIGDEFDMADWPLHVTLADTFAIDRSATDIDTKLAVLLASLPAATTKVARESVLGTASVMLLEPTSSLIALHAEIRKLLLENGTIFNHPEFTGVGFIPHSTIQKTGRLETGKEIHIDSVSLVDMFPASNWQNRKILATFATM